MTTPHAGGLPEPEFTLRVTVRGKPSIRNLHGNLNCGAAHCEGCQGAKPAMVSPICTGRGSVIWNEPHRALTGHGSTDAGTLVYGQTLTAGFDVRELVRALNIMLI